MPQKPIEKKIIILVMLCNLPQYKNKEIAIRNSWAKSILEGQYKNIDLYFFNSGEENQIDKENHMITVKCNDLRDRTFQKVMKTINLIDNDRIEYDYIVRINTSTYINVKLLNEILKRSPDSSYLYTGTSFMQPWICNKLPFLSGECIVLSKENVELAKDFYQKNLDHFNKLEADPRKDTKWVCDDGWMTILYFKHYKEKYFDKIHQLGIVFTNGKELEHIEEIERWPLICYKTVFNEETDKVDLDKDPKYDDIDLAKLSQIHIIVENMTYDIESWYKDYILTVYDQCCFSLESVMKTQFAKRNFDERISKYELIKRFYAK